MTNPTNYELITELRDEAEFARVQTRPDPEGYGMICRLEANEDLLDQAADALESLTATLTETEADLQASRSVIKRVKNARAGHPVCRQRAEDDMISCGWKAAVLDIDAALSGEVPLKPITERWAILAPQDVAYAIEELQRAGVSSENIVAGALVGTLELAVARFARLT